MFSKKWNKVVAFGILGGCLVAMPHFIKSDYLLHMFILNFIAIIMAVSLRMLLRNGLLSFGHGAFAGVGGYCSALLMMKLGLPFIASFLLSGLFTALIGALLLFPALRVKGSYFVILSWAVGEVFIAIYKIAKDLTGGTRGLFDIPKAQIFGFQLLDKIDYFYVSLVLMAITLLLCYRIDRTQFGHVVRGINWSDDLTESVGINLSKYKVMNFSLAALFAGWSGSIMAHYIGFLDPNMFGLTYSEAAVTAVLVGGSSTILGTTIGAILITILPETLAFAAHNKMLFYGALLILSMIFLPEGLISLPGRLRKKRVASEKVDAELGKIA